MLPAGKAGEKIAADRSSFDIPGKPRGSPHPNPNPSPSPHLLELLPIHAPVELKIVKAGEASQLFPARTSFAS